MGDRYIPKRSDQDMNLAAYEINHKDSPPAIINRDEFDNSIEYEETKSNYINKIEYNAMLKDVMFN
jgi:hypothetical protein